MPTRLPLALIYNPQAGSRLRFRRRPGPEEVAAALRQHGGAPVLLPTRDRNDAVALAADAAHRFPVIAVLGGDGTVNEVVNGMVAARSNARLLVLPGGSVNVLARDFKIPLDPCRAAALLQEGIERLVFLGRAGERYFVLMAGAGVDASIVHRLGHGRLKRRLGPLAFILEGCRHALFYRFPRLTVRSEAGQFTGYMVVVGNSPGYGGWFSITPGADPGQPGFEVAVCRSSFSLKYFYFMGLALAGALHRSSDFVYLHVPRLEISSDAPARVQVDGEPDGMLPMEFVSDGTCLRFLVPPPRQFRV